MSELISEFQRWITMRNKVCQMRYQAEGTPAEVELDQHIANADKELARLSVLIAKDEHSEAILETNTD